MYECDFRIDTPMRKPYRKVMVNPVERLEPAASIIDRLGGIQKVASAIGLSPTCVMRWRYPKAKGGSDGFVPSRRQQALLDAARIMGVDLTPSDFFVDRAA